MPGTVGIEPTTFGILVPRGVGSIKRLVGTSLQGHFWILKRAPKKFPPEMLTVGGEKKNFPVIPIITEIARF
jgi:hypothetical protein